MHYKQLHYCVYQADDICRHTLYYACTATVVTCCQSRGTLTQCLLSEFWFQKSNINFEKVLCSGCTSRLFQNFQPHCTVFIMLNLYAYSDDSSPRGAMGEIMSTESNPARKDDWKYEKASKWTTESLFCFTEYYKCPAHRTDRLLYTEAAAKNLELKKKER